MRPSRDCSVIPMFLSLLVGAAAGALLVALNTNKPSREQQRQAKLLARGSNRGAGAVAKDGEGLLADWQAHQTCRPESEAP